MTADDSFLSWSLSDLMLLWQEAVMESVMVPVAELASLCGGDRVVLRQMTLTCGSLSLCYLIIVVGCAVLCCLQGSTCNFVRGVL